MPITTARARVLSQRAATAAGLWLAYVSLFASEPSVLAQVHRIPVEPGRVEVTLVLLDAVVTDKKGNSIPGLTKEDFDLLIDNVRSPIEALEERCAGAGPGGPGPAPVSDRGAERRGVDGAEAAGGASAGHGISELGRSTAELRHFILFFDMSHLKMPARNRAIKTSIQFVNEAMGETDRAMILAFAKGLYVISGFTGDRALLRARLESMIEDRKLIDTTPFEEENYLGSSYRAFHPPSRSGRGVGVIGSGASASVSSGDCIAEGHFSEIEAMRAVRAIANTMPGFEGIPGRKALIFFSETLRANPSRPYYEACRVSFFERQSLGLTLVPEITDLARRANLAGVSFYPLHPGGLSDGPSDEMMEESLGFQNSIALSTEGKAFVLMNKPLVAFDQAARDLDCRYVIAYRPPEEFRVGRHSVRIALERKDLQVRHRESFFIQGAAESSEHQTMAVLSNPGLYRDLPVEAHGFSLAEAEKGKRGFLLQTSVPLRELTFLPRAEAEWRGSVLIRGGIVSAKGRLTCEFAETIGLESARPSSEVPTQAGIQSLCEIEPGENEIVVAARDEVGGSLGTFWGKIRVKEDEGATRPSALLWTPPSGDVWVRPGESSWLPAAASDTAGVAEPLIVNSSRVMSAREPAVVTFVACRPGEAGSRSGPRSPEPAFVRLEGEIGSLTLAAHESGGTPGARCKVLSAEIPAASLPLRGHTPSRRRPCPRGRSSDRR